MESGGELAAQWRALAEGVGLVDFTRRTQVELKGEDRAAFLHNLSTNEIRRLAVGAGCEAFLTNLQGKVLGHVLVFCGKDSLVIETVPEQAPKIIAHLDRYLIREKVVLADRSDDWAELLVSGPASEKLLAGLIGEVPGPRLTHREAAIGGRNVQVRRVDMAGPAGFLLSAERDSVAPIADALVAAGAVPCAQEAAEAARIEAGWPDYGRDITDENLPQEVARDDRAISFVKGCYLGQETVARIDALGHVNKTLVGVKFQAGPLPAAGAELTSGEKAVGRTTSVAFSPRLGAPLALAYVRRGHNQAGTRLDSAFGPAEVFSLPLGGP
jgi:folate-binding protein YgfZ